MLDLQLSYAAIMDIIYPLFTVVLQDILDMKQVANLDNLFVTLRAYEQQRAQRQQMNSASAPRFLLPLNLTRTGISPNRILFGAGEVNSLLLKEISSMLQRGPAQPSPSQLTYPDYF